MLINLIKKLTERGITIAFASHDMPFIHATLDRVYFMQDGAIIESFDAAHDAVSDTKYISSFLESR